MKVAWAGYIQDAYSQAGLKNEPFYTSIYEQLVNEHDSLRDLRTEILADFL